MKVAVFGAAGWVGRAILENLSGCHEVRAVDLFPEAWDSCKDVDGEWDEGEKIHADIVDYGATDSAIEGMDAVIHASDFEQYR